MGRKISDLTADNANVLLSKLPDFRSNLDEKDEGLPTDLLEKLQESSENLEKWR